MFKNITFTNNRYSIDEYGVVKRNEGQYESRNQKEKVLKSYINNKGYRYIDLRIDGKTQKFLIHRLVAMAYIDNPNNYPVVNHIDCNPLNNHYSNLEWCTMSHNNKWAYDKGNRVLTEKQIKGRQMSKTTLYKKVAQYDLENNKLIKEFESVTQVNKELGFSISAIANCCNGITKTSYRFVWKYI